MTSADWTDALPAEACVTRQGNRADFCPSDHLKDIQITVMALKII